jgi:hypothetical protein
MQAFKGGHFIGAEFSCNCPTGKSLHQSIALFHGHVVNEPENLLDEDDGTLAVARRDPLRAPWR